MSIISTLFGNKELKNYNNHSKMDSSQLGSLPLIHKYMQN